MRARVAAPKTSMGYVFLNALLKVYLKSPITYPILEPPGSRILSVPRRYLAILCLVLVKGVLLQGLWTLEESSLFISEPVWSRFTEVFQKAPLKVVGTTDVQGPLLAKTRQFIDASGGRDSPRYLGAFHRAPLLRDRHHLLKGDSYFKNYCVSIDSNVTIATIDTFDIVV